MEACHFNFGDCYGCIILGGTSVHDFVLLFLDGRTSHVLCLFLFSCCFALLLRWCFCDLVLFVALMMLIFVRCTLRSVVLCGCNS